MAVLGLTVAGLVLAGPGTADAAPTGASSSVGYDVSHPQCGQSLPTGPAFAVVGVNGGTAVKANPCLSTQLRWAAGSTGAVAAQPPVQLYLNTANPGQVLDLVTTWPASGTNRYGSCDGSNSAACSYEYGVERATYSVRSIFAPAARSVGLATGISAYTWWLDVETGNTWQNGSTAALARNRATLEGMTDFLTSSGGRVGLYSTGTQWRQVVGTVPSTSTLAPLRSWLAGSTSLSGAITTCAKAPLTRGPVVLTQYVVGGLDRDRSC
jgi:hypothetical protein